MFKRYINSKLWRYIACVLRSAVKFYEPFHTRVLQLSVNGCKCGTILGPSDWKGTNSDTTGSIYSDLSVKQSQCTRLLRKARGAEDYLNLDHYNFALMAQMVRAFTSDEEDKVFGYRMQLHCQTLSNLCKCQGSNDNINECPVSSLPYPLLKEHECWVSLVRGCTS